MIAPQPKPARVYVREPLRRRARLREAAMRHVARHGLYGLNLNAIARRLGEKHAIVRWHFKTNHGLLLDVVQTHHIRLGEALAEPMLAVRALPATERLSALIAAVLEAMIAAGDWHRAAVAIAASLPEVALALRNADLWLVDALSAAMRPRDPVRARTLLMLIEQWALRMGDANAAERAACVGALAAMVGWARARTPMTGRRPARQGDLSRGFKYRFIVPAPSGCHGSPSPVPGHRPAVR